MTVSYLGMTTQNVKVTNGKPLRIVMKPDAKQLDEVVVTGYVKISKNSFTGTSVTVSADQLMSVSKRMCWGLCRCLTLLSALLKTI